MAFFRIPKKRSSTRAATPTSPMRINSPLLAAALRGVHGEATDVITVGAMRDSQTIWLALTAAETVHLVLGTLHRSNATHTHDRLLDVFPPEQEEQARIMVNQSLRGVSTQ